MFPNKNWSLGGLKLLIKKLTTQVQLFDVQSSGWRPRTVRTVPALSIFLISAVRNALNRVLICSAAAAAATNTGEVGGGSTSSWRHKTEASTCCVFRALQPVSLTRARLHLSLSLSLSLSVSNVSVSLSVTHCLSVCLRAWHMNLYLWNDRPMSAAPCYSYNWRATFQKCMPTFLIEIENSCRRRVEFHWN